MPPRASVRLNAIGRVNAFHGNTVVVDLWDCKHNMSFKVTLDAEPFRRIGIKANGKLNLRVVRCPGRKDRFLVRKIKSYNISPFNKMQEFRGRHLFQPPRSAELLRTLRRIG